MKFHQFFMICPALWRFAPADFCGPVVDRPFAFYEPQEIQGIRSLRAADASAHWRRQQPYDSSDQNDAPSPMKSEICCG